MRAHISFKDFVEIEVDVFAVLWERHAREALVYQTYHAVESYFSFMRPLQISRTISDASLRSINNCANLLLRWFRKCFPLLGDSILWNLASPRLEIRELLSLSFRFQDGGSIANVCVC